jgi:hypothetical protein
MLVYNDLRCLYQQLTVKPERNILTVIAARLVFRAAIFLSIFFRRNIMSKSVEFLNNVCPLSYVAGLLDAEGSFNFAQKAYPRIAVYNNNIELLQYAQNVIGGATNSNYRGEHCLSLSSMKDVFDACEKMIPYLKLKKRQAVLLSDAVKTNRQNRATLVEEVSKLNNKELLNFNIESDKKLIERDLVSPTQKERSYFGGWLDGDSSIVFQPQTFKATTYQYVWLHVYSVNPEPLLHIQEWFGGKLESRQREGKCARIYSLEFEDQFYVPKVLRAVRDYVIEKREQIDIALEASKFEPKDRAHLVQLMKAANTRFRGRHKFNKNEDGTYTEDKTAHAKSKGNCGRRKHQGMTWSLDENEKKEFDSTATPITPIPQQPDLFDETEQPKIDPVVPPDDENKDETDF